MWIQVEISRNESAMTMKLKLLCDSNTIFANDKERRTYACVRLYVMNVYA